MQNYPLVDVLVYFSCHQRSDVFEWHPSWRCDIERIRSGHTKRDGGGQTAWYMVETKQGSILELCYDAAELRWYLPKSVANEAYTDRMEIDRVLAWSRRHRNIPTLDKRLTPYRFELRPLEERKRQLKTKNNHFVERLPALAERLSPFRLMRDHGHSFQTDAIVTRHVENLMTTKHLHYVLKTSEDRYYHLVFEKDLGDWRLVQEVDAEFFFAR